MMWKSGDVCYLVTHKKKKTAAAFEVLRQREDGYYMVRILNGGTAVAASAKRMFKSKEEAIASIDNGT